MRKRLLSLLLAFVMVLGMLPVSAFANEIPFTAALNGTACAVKPDGTEVYVDYGFELPAYLITVPAGTASDAEVSLTGDILTVTSEDGVSEYQPTAIPVAFGVNYVVIGSNSMGPDYVIRFAAEQSEVPSEPQESEPANTDPVPPAEGSDCLTVKADAAEK